MNSHQNDSKIKGFENELDWTKACAGKAWNHFEGRMGTNDVFNIVNESFFEKVADDYRDKVDKRIQVALLLEL